MLALGAWEWLISVAIIGISVLLIGLVLLQKNRGSGLSGAFGGVGGHSAFGTKTGDFLTWFTVGLAVLFLILCVAGNFAFEPERKTPRGTANAALIDSGDDGDANDNAATGTTPTNSTTQPANN